MKIHLFIAFIILAFSVKAQVPNAPPNFVTNAEYAYKKANGLLVGDELILSDNMVNPNSIKGGIPFVVNFTQPKAIGCNGYFPPTTPPFQFISSDDASAIGGPFTIPFPFCFYGDTVTQFWANSNGNITFDGPLTTYTSGAFPSTIGKIIAAYWADWDIAGPSATYCYGVVSPTSIVVNWHEGGYFPDMVDKLNSCQIIITDGNDPIIISGNLKINYADMQWTTGSASGGAGGFGGQAATCGANQGNGVDFFQIGQFDHPGVDYDGPTGLVDGVSWLDNKSFVYNICAVGNLPPAPQGSNICDTLASCSISAPLQFSFPYSAVENTQSCSITWTTTAPPGVLTEITNVSGNTAFLVLESMANPPIGNYTITITATDNFSPPGVTTNTYPFDVTDITLAYPILPTIVYNPTCLPVTFEVTGGPWSSYLWSNNGSTVDTTVINSVYNGTLNVLLTSNGCPLLLDTVISVTGLAPIVISGNTFYCSNLGYASAFIQDSASFGNITWSQGATVVSNFFSPKLLAGTYTLTVFDPTNTCTSVQTVIITTVPPLTLENDKEICLTGSIATLQFMTNTGGGGFGSWGSFNSPSTPTFSNQNLNCLVTFPTPGTYSLVYTTVGCIDKDTVVIKVIEPYIFNFACDFKVCPGVQEIVTVSNNPGTAVVSYAWTPPVSTTNTAILGPGTYKLEVTAAGIAACKTDTIFTIVEQPKIIINVPPQICGDSLSFANNTGSSTGIWSYFGDGIATFDTIRKLKGSVEVDTFGIYNFKYTDSICGDYDTVRVVFVDNPVLTLPADFATCEGNTSNILASIEYPNLMDSIIWSNGVKNVDNINVNIENQYIVTGFNFCGIIKDTINFELRPCDIVMPDIFTPDGDTLNSTWKLLNYEDSTITSYSIAIVNRWGQSVFISLDPNKGWDGKDRGGNPVDDGVYFFTANGQYFDKTFLKKQGSITVIRK